MAEDKAEKTADDIPFSKKIRAIWHHIRRYRKELITVSVLGIISAVANGTVPLLVGRFLDALIRPATFTLPHFGPIPIFIALLALWVIVQLIANTTDWIIGRISRKLGTNLQAQYIVDAYSHILTLPVSFFKNQKSGELSELVSRASWMLDTIVSSVLINLAPQFLSIAVGIAISFYLQPLLASVLLLGILLYIITLIRIILPVAGLQAKVHRLWRTAYGKAYDAYANLQTVKNAGAEEFEQQKATDAFFSERGERGAAVQWNKLEMSWNDINAYQRILVLGTQLTIFSLSIDFVLHGTLTIGDLIAFNAYASMVFGPFVSLGSQWQTVQNGLTAAAQAEDVFDTASEIYDPPHAVSLADFHGDVSFNDVHFSYETGQPEVLSGVSWEAKAGQVIAFVGETGVGKSTSTELISGYYFPTSGTVSIDGHDIRTVSLRELRRNIAIVPQEVVLFNASIMDNIRYGRPEATDEEVRAAATKAHADAFIEKFPEKYEQVVGDRGIKLSVGQKQRVAIARAILRDPRILILDEPTSALDAETERYITSSLEELMRGRTTFIVAHRLSTVRQADQIIVLKAGKVAEQGTHDKLLQIKNGAYRHLYDLHIGLHE
ncbi:MAG: ABC transporter ATP-binding protein [Candidatus Pacebacteria bacterium]|nr:ABC transporter ATP-binding protein [Candidatus Paceibacterota bacterium]